ncbi:DUF397 domain-containing protein [Streptacidiphilus sp. PB12-B1b]|uniref:DUF397 domain-containing protein n=1 Tax=Streptacidiphilus sp. PB12-B1b TaxID=2705012 RepID=UPI0015F97426|nr:DUF397 domain-containing protein [Streptacidiphilus sp. PB12-B1b]QMU79112.1 DUF397 domain-containing protein [Streptacidiphilus sp. PB12-B1b]
MSINFDSLNWFKATASGQNGACVEIAHLADGGVALRDSKDRALAPHVYTAQEWDAFLDGARKGEFDRPQP